MLFELFSHNLLTFGERWEDLYSFGFLGLILCVGKKPNVYKCAVDFLLVFLSVISMLGRYFSLCTTLV